MTLGILSQDRLAKAFEDYPESRSLEDIDDLADFLEQIGMLTPFQARSLRENRLADLVMDNYLILDRLGQGGMGMVFRAMHKRMKRVVAIKVLNQETKHNEDNLARFQREVESIARLNHPGIMQAYDADTGPLGFFLVLEFVEGSDLEKVVRKNGPLEVPEAIDAILQAALALQYVHDQGMVHRDIKPPNLMRTRQGQIKVADMGLVRMAATAEPQAHTAELTKEFTIAGTLEYMAPEQAEDTRGVDHRADIYSLGCTLYYILVGKDIYPAKSVIDKILAHRAKPIPSLCSLRPDVPKALDDIFQKMVAKDTDSRYQTMTALAKDLQALVSQLGVGMSKQIQSTVAMDSPETKAEVNYQATATIQIEGAGRVLLLEPSRAQGIVIASQIKKLGFPSVQVCATAKDALEQISRGGCQAVLSSLHLPDMPGLEFLAKATKILGSGNIPRVLTTSEINPELQAEAEKLGIKLLKKPFHPEDLKTVLVAPGDGPAKTLSLDPNAAPQKILLVDDSPSARRRMITTLAKMGFPTPQEAGNGQEGLQWAQTGNFDLVITDFHMPQMDGKELVEKIHANQALKNLTVMLVTCDTDSFLLDPIRSLHQVKIISKSLPGSELEKAFMAHWKSCKQGQKC